MQRELQEKGNILLDLSQHPTNTQGVIQGVCYFMHFAEFCRDRDTFGGVLNAHRCSQNFADYSVYLTLTEIMVKLLQMFVIRLQWGFLLKWYSSKISISGADLF